MKKTIKIKDYIGISMITLTVLIVLLILCGIIKPPYDPNEMNGGLKNMSPSLSHLFGTDNFGRDILSRCMEGSRTTFIIALITVTLGSIIGTVIGAVSGYYGGFIDEVLMRINDVIATFPSILLAIVVISVIGMGKYNVILALVIVFIPSFARVIRSEFITIKERDYVKNAKLIGVSNLRIMFVHILPNTLPILLSSLTIGFNNAVLAEASMSYLGLGVQPPDASLGRMLSESQTYIFSAPWYALAPGCIIVLAVLSVSILGEKVIKR